MLKWIEPDQHVVALTNTYLQFYLAIPPLEALTFLLRLYIVTSGRTQSILFIFAFGNVVNILSHYICLYHLHMDIRAAPISMTLAYTAIVLCSIVYIRTSPIYEETWHPVTYACLQEWDVYLKLAVPGVMSIM